MSKRRNYDARFNGRMMLAAQKGERTVSGSDIPQAWIYSRGYIDEWA